MVFSRLFMLIVWRMLLDLVRWLGVGGEVATSGDEVADSVAAAAAAAADVWRVDSCESGEMVVLEVVELELLGERLAAGR